MWTWESMIMMSCRARHAEGWAPSPLPLPAPLGRQRRPRNFLPAQIDAVDPPRIGNVIERISVEHDEVRALAGRDSAEVGEPEIFRRVAGADHQRLHRGEPDLCDQQLQLDVGAEPEEL